MYVNKSNPAKIISGYTQREREYFGFLSVTSSRALGEREVLGSAEFVITQGSLR